MKFTIVILCFYLISINCLFAQKAFKVDNSIKYLQIDTPIMWKLREYLLEHPTTFTKDVKGRVIPFTRDELIDMHKDDIIFVENLRHDSLSLSDSKIGIYRFGFLSLNEPSWLYLQYKNRIEFLDINQDRIHLHKILKRISRFYKKKPSLTPIEKIKMLERSIDVIYENAFEEISW